VLKAHDVLRVPRTSTIAFESQLAGKVYDGRGPSGPSDEGRKRDILMQWGNIWYHDVKDEVKEAERMLFGMGAFVKGT
jgi:salicylate hydroxylase